MIKNDKHNPQCTDEGNDTLGGVSGSDIPKYTEEQVREAIEMAREPEYWESGSYWGNAYSPDEIIEELNKDN